jgi:L-aspartate oxidase
VVAKAIMRRMRETGAAHVWLDARHFGAPTWQRRFPTILASCREHGIDPVTDLIPVAPACHYASGGVATDLHGRTTVPGLYACGEVACTGVHGANRLASNSLLEGLVFARRIAADLARELPSAREPAPEARRPGLVDPGAVPTLQRTMTEDAGVLRTAAGLGHAAKVLAEVAVDAGAVPHTEAWEAANLVTVGQALVTVAQARQETRGCHWRDDHPGPDPRWAGHLDSVLTASGQIETTFRALGER